MELIKIIKEKPKDFPEIIYKFRDWQNEKHKTVLFKNQLYLSSPKDFNDPFDCRIPEDLSSLDTLKKRNDFADQFVIRHFNDPQVQGKEKYWLEEIPRRLEIEPEEMQKRNEEILFIMQDKHYGVVSFSCIWNNILLWAHYAANHSGFCVGFKEEKLRGFPRFSGGGRVIYQRDFPQLNPLEKKEENEVITRAFTETFTKAEDWEYEKEYRILKLFFPKEPSIEDRIIALPDDFFSEINIGLNFPPKDIHAMIQIANEKKIAIYQTRKVPFKFELDRIQWN